MISVLIRRKGDRENFTLYYVDPITKREKTRSAKTADYKQAVKNAGRWEDELRRTRGAGDSGWDFVRRRFEDEHVAGLANNTKEAYCTALNSFRRFWKGDNLTEITPSVISQFQAWLRADKYPQGTIGSYLRHLKTLLRWAVKMRIVADVPAIIMPKMPKNASKGRPLNDDEWRLFLRTCPDPQWVRFAEMIYLSGFRLEEACIASWDGPRIRIELQQKRIFFRADSHKSREDMYVPMTPDFHAWLMDTPERLRKGLICPLECDSNSRRGKPFTGAGSVGKAVRKIGREAGIVTGRNRFGSPTFAGSHDLRRTFGTIWATRVKPLTLQRLMRHTDFTTTLKYYVSLSLEDISNDVWSAVPINVPNRRQIAWLRDWAACDFRDEYHD